ncbi:MAG: cell wall hydrolase [Christensenellales bacterium]
MGRLFAALFLCALLLTALALPKKPAQPVFFSMLFEQLLPEWTLGRSDAGRGGGGGADMAVSKRGARIVAAGLFRADAAVCVCADGAGGGLLGAERRNCAPRAAEAQAVGLLLRARWTACSVRGTYDAVIQLSEKNGLRADGVAGAATLAAMGVSEKAAASAVTTAASGYASEVELLARLIHGEARGEPYVGMVAVGAVVLNRVRSSRFPNTLAGVIYQSGAFDAVSDGQINLAPSEQSRRAARDALNGWDPTGGCLYYYNPATATSPWIWSREVRLTIGDHSFAV